MKRLIYVGIVPALFMVWLAVDTPHGPGATTADESEGWTLQLADSQMAVYQIGMADQLVLVSVLGTISVGFVSSDGFTIVRKALRALPSEWLRGTGPTDTIDVLFNHTNAIDDQLNAIARMPANTQVLLCLSTTPVASGYVSTGHLHGWLISDSLRPSLTGILRPAPDSVSVLPGTYNPSRLDAILDAQSADALFQSADVILVGTAADSFTACMAAGRHTLCQDVQVDSVLFGEEDSTHVLVTGYSSINWNREPLILYLNRDSTGIYTPALLSTGVVAIRSGRADKLNMDLEDLASLIRLESSRIKLRRDE